MTAAMTMQAALCHRYGPPEAIHLARIPRPRPRRGEVLIKVQAAGVTTGDARIRGAQVPEGMGPLIRLIFGLRGPRRPVLGREFAGTIVEHGAGAPAALVGSLPPGTAVFGITPGIRMGTHADYLCMPAKGLLLPRPPEMSLETAAAFFFGGLTAADFLLDQCALQPGERVLVVGATGAVGAAAVQIARAHGARVTALASTANLDLARALGAQEVLDYRAGTLRGEWDVILDIPGVLDDGQRHLARGGRLALITATLRQTLAANLRPGGARRAGVTRETHGAMTRLLELYQTGAYQPLIGTALPFTRIIEAHALASSGHKRGNVVVLMQPPAEAPAPEDEQLRN
ncbi:MAG: NAD(P)-dependent alcohol dehydrogenase [Pararhodobacter sp.]